MSPPIAPDPPHRAGFPRVSGDEPPDHVLRRVDSEFSPRERG